MYLLSKLGYGSLNQGEEKVHGSPLSGKLIEWFIKKWLNSLFIIFFFLLDADIKQVKEKFGFNGEEKYVVPQEVRKKKDDTNG